MSQPVNIPSDPVSFTAAARLISAIEGQAITRQGLTEYLTKHAVPTTVVGKRRKVLMSDVIEARASFTREVMRGEHLRDPNPSPDQPTASAPESLSAAAAARDAKARKENAQAESAELALAKEKEHLVSVFAAEGAAASAMMSAKSFLIGPAISQSADSLLSDLNLPESKKRDIETVLAKTYRTMLSQLSQNIIDEFSLFNTSIAAGLPSRLDILTDHAARLRGKSNADLINDLAKSELPSRA